MIWVVNRPNHLTFTTGLTDLGSYVTFLLCLLVLRLQEQTGAGGADTL